MAAGLTPESSSRQQVCSSWLVLVGLCVRNPPKKSSSHDTELVGLASFDKLQMKAIFHDLADYKAGFGSKNRSYTPDVVLRVPLCQESVSILHEYAQ